MTERHYWKCRLVAKGPHVGVVTWFGAPLIDGEELDRHYRWNALVRQETTSRAILMGAPCPIEVDGVFLRNIEPISETDYRLMTAISAWATQHRPDRPEAAPKTAIDWNKTTPIFGRKA